MAGVGGLNTFTTIPNVGFLPRGATNALKPTRISGVADTPPNAGQWEFSQKRPPPNHDAQRPITGADWNNYFNAKYGAENVQWKNPPKPPPPPKLGTLSNEEARRWYLDQEAKIPDLNDRTKSPEQQARQAFKLRNQIRIEARELMADRELADHLNATKPNLTWEQVVSKYSERGLSGDALWHAIMESSTRSNPAVNESLGLFSEK